MFICQITFRVLACIVRLIWLPSFWFFISLTFSSEINALWHISLDLLLLFTQIYCLRLVEIDIPRMDKHLHLWSWLFMGQSNPFEHQIVPRTSQALWDILWLWVFVFGHLQFYLAWVKCQWKPFFWRFRCQLYIHK